MLDCWADAAPADALGAGVGTSALLCAQPATATAIAKALNIGTSFIDFFSLLSMSRRGLTPLKNALNGLSVAQITEFC
jgi:hypothetical protein